MEPRELSCRRWSRKSIRWIATIEELDGPGAVLSSPALGGLESRPQAAARRIVFSSSSLLQFLQTFRST